MKRIWKRIRRLWCRHDSGIRDIKIYARPKYKHVKKGYCKLRFDIWEEHRCHECGIFLSKIKIKSDLTETQTKLYLDNYF